MDIYAIMKKKKCPLWFEPFEGLNRIEEEVHRMMREIPFQMPKMRIEFARTIPIDIAESEKELLLRAELPGFNKDEIKLKVTPTTIGISAEKKKISIDKGENFFRQERAYGSARRVMTLPAEVKTEGIKAKFENGILQVMMKKKEIVKKKEVKVE